MQRRPKKNKQFRCYVFIWTEKVNILIVGGKMHVKQSGCMNYFKKRNRLLYLLIFKILNMYRKKIKHWWNVNTDVKGLMDIFVFFINYQICNNFCTYLLILLNIMHCFYCPIGRTSVFFVLIFLLNNNNSQTMPLKRKCLYSHNLTITPIERYSSVVYKLLMWTLKYKNGLR